MSNTSLSQTLSPNDCWKNRYGTVLCHVKANLEGQTPKYTIYMYCHCDSYISSYYKQAQQKCVSYLWQHKNAHSHGSVHVNANPEEKTLTNIQYTIIDTHIYKELSNHKRAWQKMLRISSNTNNCTLINRSLGLGSIASTH